MDKTLLIDQLESIREKLERVKIYADREIKHSNSVDYYIGQKSLSDEILKHYFLD